jgi:hypothetical protein
MDGVEPMGFRRVRHKAFANLNGYWQSTNKNAWRDGTSGARRVPRLAGS